MTMLFALLLMISDQEFFAAKKQEMQAAQSEWNDCAVSSAKRMAKTTVEPASDVATAALGICGVHEFAMRSAAREALSINGSSGTKTEAAIDRAKGDLREMLVAVVIATRTK